MRKKRLWRKRVAVFDINSGECAATAEAVRAYYGADTAWVEEFTDMQRFVETFGVQDFIGDGYDAVFLGVDGMLGVETGRNIRELNKRFPLFFVSHSWDYGLEAHRLHALNYLIKPVSGRDVGEAEERIRWQRKVTELAEKSLAESRLPRGG